jgi:hypothetical protein
MCRDWEVIHSNPHSHILKEMFLTFVWLKKMFLTFFFSSKLYLRVFGQKNYNYGLSLSNV